MNNLFHTKFRIAERYRAILGDYTLLLGGKSVAMFLDSPQVKKLVANSWHFSFLPPETAPR